MLQVFGPASPNLGVVPLLRYHEIPHTGLAILHLGLEHFLELQVDWRSLISLV